jgi:hypothetical protein
LTIFWAKSNFNYTYHISAGPLEGQPFFTWNRQKNTRLLI